MNVQRYALEQDVCIIDILILFVDAHHILYCQWLFLYICTLHSTIVAYFLKHQKEVESIETFITYNPSKQ